MSQRMCSSSTWAPAPPLLSQAVLASSQAGSWTEPRHHERQALTTRYMNSTAQSRGRRGRSGGRMTTSVALGERAEVKCSRRRWHHCWSRCILWSQNWWNYLHEPALLPASLKLIIVAWNASNAQMVHRGDLLSHTHHSVLLASPSGMVSTMNNVSDRSPSPLLGYLQSGC
jgi:hypothetical protein